jgi:hypothetical protein
MRRKSRRAWAEAAAREADEALLRRRLVEIHENSTVLVSLTPRGVLRLHRGFAYASDKVVQALAAFAHPEAGPADQRRAERMIVAFPIDQYVRRRARLRPRRERPRPGDRRLLGRLKELHRELNERHFGGALGSIDLRISGRMRTCLGELTVDSESHSAVEIAISRHHLECDPWDEVVHTLLHEMVHQWQAEAGHGADHGPGFRRKAREVGIAPVATRDIREVPPPASAAS